MSENPFLTRTKKETIYEEISVNNINEYFINYQIKDLENRLKRIQNEKLKRQLVDELKTYKAIKHLMDKAKEK